MVIAVILILAGITFGISRGVQNAQASAKAKAELAVIAQGLEQFKSTYGDYPWIAETTSGANANTLLKCLTGWMKLERNASSGNVELVSISNGKSFIDPTKLSLSDTLPSNGDPGDDIYLMDPWGNPYVYGYNKGDTWDAFGYVLFSSGPDSKESMSWNDGTGVINQTFRDLGDNIDNIYAGE